MLPRKIQKRNTPHPMRIFLRENVLSKEVCNDIINYSKRLGVDFGRYKQNIGNYCTVRIPLESPEIDLASILDPIWEEAIEYFKVDVSWTEQYEIKKYVAGDDLEQHIDHYYGREINHEERKLSMILKLNDPIEHSGGRTFIWKSEHCQTIGSLVIFPSFYPHTITRVDDGVRWSLNSWVWGPQWR